MNEKVNSRRICGFKTNIKILISCYVHYFDPKNGLKLKKKWNNWQIINGLRPKTENVLIKYVGGILFLVIINYV